MDKDTFVLRAAYRKQFSRLSMEERGELITAILDYENGETPGELSPLVDMAFSFIRDDLDYNSQQYEKKCAKNRENGKSGGRPRKKTQYQEEKPNGFFENPEEQVGYSQNPNDIDSDNDSDNDKYPPISPQGDGGGFEEFWSAYPRKAGKGEARRAWEKLGPSQELFRRILEALKLARASPQWTREKGRYIPSPARWLEQEGWQDEFPQPDSSYDIDELEEISKFNLPEDL